MLGTDGLFKHASREAIVAACAGDDVTAMADRLVGLPRLRSRAYPDDVAVVVMSPGTARRELHETHVR